MKIALLGAGGRTGRKVIELALAEGHTVRALVRRAGGAIEAPGLEVHVGDALDANDVRTLLRGCDAALNVIAPRDDSPPDLSSRSGQVLIEAMLAEGVTKLAVVTGAMQGDRDELGWLYRRLANAASIRPLLEDRRREEEMLRASGLEVTILRPPRLTDGDASEGGPELGESILVRMLDHASRADLARALLDAVVRGVGAGRTLFVRSR
jgi:putative NADH-flavin reductase